MYIKQLLLFVTGSFTYLQMQAVNLESVYTLQPEDEEAYYFQTAYTDGKTDVSKALQMAINQVKKEKNFGILFIPEGKYKISETIYIPNAIRLIGYGKKRPEFILAKKSPGYQQEVRNDKGGANYMFWFTGSIVENQQPIPDANAGTFYSAMSNINLRIEDGNPFAIALRTHYAQHCFISHVSISTGKGKAGIFDVGNELENVAFYGGDYGIYTTKASPGWPVVMVDSYFEGQRCAAVRSQESGLAMVNMQVKNVPTVFDIDPEHAERLYIENSRFENISDAVFIVSNPDNSNNQLTIRNTDCRNVPVLAKYRRADINPAIVRHKLYKIKNFAHGLQMDDLSAQPEYRTTLNIEPIQEMPLAQARNIPDLPPMETWVNIRDLGAVGDNITDDTKAIQEAMDKYDNIYVPQGWYRISQTLKMKPHTRMIGLHPFATQFCLPENTPAFSGFGPPKALLESAEGGVNIFNGIGINTGTWNYRAVGIKWMSGAASYLNDVKFVGGHGSMNKPSSRQTSTAGNPISAQAIAAWDNQYWSFWITNNGGGTIKDVWTASTCASSGLYVNNTHTPGRIYGMSVEHHVRNEARLKDVSNWKIYALQFEEESRESLSCLPLELENCSGLLIANLYLFRVIRIATPYPYAIRTWNCKDLEFINVHNYAQTKYTSTNTLYDINRDIEIRPWDFQYLYISGKESRHIPLSDTIGKVEELASGFEFAEGITKDSKGNIYFCENRLRRIYKWSAETNTLSLIADFPWKPLNLATDSGDHLLVSFRYDLQPPGYSANGQQELFPTLPDAKGTSYSGYGNSDSPVLFYSIDPDHPEETIKEMELIPVQQVGNIHKALYPSNRRRDRHDFNEVAVYVPEKCFLAPDGKTIIPQYFDLARSSALSEAFPGSSVYISDEYRKRTVQMNVAADGTLSDLKYFAEWGEFNSAVDNEGNVYIAEGQIYVFDQYGRKKNVIHTPERPSCIQFGGKDGNTLFIISRSKLFRVRIK
jgi:sugar lactone lactonase YvrE